MTRLTAGPEAQLEDLLGESLDAVKVRERTTFDRQIAPYGSSLVLFGAGNLGRQVLHLLRLDGIHPLAFSDNDPALWHTSIDDVQVLPPHEAAESFGGQAVFMVTIWNPRHSCRETRQQLRALGCREVISVAPFRWKHADALLPFFWADLPHKICEQAERVRAAFALLSDDASRAEYVAQLRWRALGDIDAITTPVPEASYFPDDLFLVRPDEVYFDCGAFDGDTVASVLSRHLLFRGTVVAFEPDPGNHARLCDRLRGLTPELADRVRPFKLAMADRSGTVRFDPTGDLGAAVSPEGALRVDSVALDEFAATTGLVPTFVKMDIEGSEAAALLGARLIIERHSPILAVCIYHRQEDLWSIPLLVDSLQKDYDLFLRLHEHEGWQLVLYAVPAHRRQSGSTA